MRMNAGYWLDRATEKIRFAPDRAAVRRELEGHIQDRVERYMAQGMEKYEAGQAAVADMGDPGEIAAELGRIHAPWWGYLWRASKVALFFAIFALVVGLYNGVANGRLDQQYSGPEPPGTSVGTYTFVNQYDVKRTVDILNYWELKGSAKLSGYRFTAPMAWVEHYEASRQNPSLLDGGESYKLTVCLKSSTWKLWAPSNGAQDMILKNTPIDDAGRRYGYGDDTLRDLFCFTYQSGPGTIWYEVDLYLEGPEDVPRWVDIPVGYGDAVLRVDLEKGEVRAK